MPTTSRAWRKSSFSDHENACVEVSVLEDGGIAVRNSKRPDQAIVVVTRAEMTALVRGVKAGEFDALC